MISHILLGEHPELEKILGDAAEVTFMATTMVFQSPEIGRWGTYDYAYTMLYIHL